MGFNKPEFQGLREWHVRLGGWFSGSELAAVYRAADLITIPSICFDSAPLMALEGMAAAKPVLANCYGGARELLVDGETGYIVNPFDTETFAHQLEHVLANPDLAQRMGEAGRQRLERQFTLKMNGENMLAVYEEAIKMHQNP
jgi:glycosyltransferase involved in cell wall biosynthesis